MKLWRSARRRKFGRRPDSQFHGDHMLPTVLVSRDTEQSWMLNMVCCLNRKVLKYQLPIFSCWQRTHWQSTILAKVLTPSSLELLQWHSEFLPQGLPTKMDGTWIALKTSSWGRLSVWYPKPGWNHAISSSISFISACKKQLVAVWCQRFEVKGFKI